MVGGGRAKLNAEVMMGIELLMPSYLEQCRISEFLFNLDNLITLHRCLYHKIRWKIYLTDAVFTLSWEQRKFSSVFKGLQNNTLSRAELNYESGTVKDVHYGDVLIKFGDYIDASKTELPYISDDAKTDKFKNSFLQDGDIIIADTAEDDTVGKCTEIQGSKGLKLLSGLHTIACRPKQKYGPMFLGYYINSPAYHNQLKPLMQGIKVTSISKSALQDTDMILPKSIDEQIKIGEYFSNLDNLITLHQRKYNNTILPFKVWEQRKVSELCSISTGKSNTQDKVEDGEYPFYVRSPIIERSAKYLYDEEAVLTVGDGVGTGKVFHYVNGKYDLHQRCYRMYDFTDELNAHYFYHTFSKLFYKRVMAMTAKTSVDSVRLEMIADMEIPCPDIKEQKKIGAYFDNLDSLITLHQRKCLIPSCELDVWEQHKLGDIVGSVIGGGTPKTSVDEYWDGDIPWIQSSNVQENEMFDFDIPKRITQLGLDKSAAKLVPEKSIAVVTHVGVGKLVFVPFAYTTSQDFTSLAELKTDPKFTCYSLYKRLQDDLHIVQGSAIKGITKDDLLTKEIMVPEKNEQSKIGEYFRNLDNLITLHRRVYK